MKKNLLIITTLFLSIFVSVEPISADAPFRVDIDDESILEDDPDFLDDPPIWQLRSYTVYPRMQRHKLDKALKVVRFKAVFEYFGAPIPEIPDQKPVMGTAMCKVPNPYYFHETKIIYKGPFPLEDGKRVSVNVLIPFPAKFAWQLRKNPATCNVVVESVDGFPIQYSFEIKRAGREFEMVFRGTNTDKATPLEDMPDVLPKAYSRPAEERCRELKMWLDQGVLTQNLNGNLTEAQACNIYYHAIWTGSVPVVIASEPSPVEPPKTQTTTPPLVTVQDHIRGKLDAPITLIEYVDLDCPFCQKFHPTMKAILAAYDGKVRWVYRHFPLTSIHPNSSKKAEASECVNELGGDTAFWTFIDKLLETNPDLSQLANISESIGLDKKAFTSCLDSGKYKKLVEEHLQGGMIAGVGGTPTTFLLGPNGLTMSIMGAQSYEVVAEKIESALPR